MNFDLSQLPKHPNVQTNPCAFETTAMSSAYYIRDGYLSQDLVRIKLIRGNTQFQISIKSADIQHTTLGKKFLVLLNEYLRLEQHDMDAYMRPLDLILGHFLEVLMELAPEVEVKGSSIESFVYAPTYKLESFGMASGDEVGIRGTEECFYEPGYDIAPLSVLEAPDSWTAILKTKARDLYLVREEQELNPLKSLQGKVQTTEGREKFFKPRERGREKEFSRGVEMLLRIKEKRLAGSVHRLPVLESLVVAGEYQDQVIVGFLVNFIVSPSLGSHLLSPGIKSQTTLHQKWENQVRETVKMLHEYDIVWGDVNPCNVVIDEKLDA